MSEFKKNPAAILREANNRPVAVLNHNKAAFYMIEPELFEAIMEEIAKDATLRQQLHGYLTKIIKTDILEVQ